MERKFFLVAIASVTILTGCGLGDARQQLDAARARRDAAILAQTNEGNLSPDEAQSILSYDHGHDAAFDKSLNTPSYVEAVHTTIPTPSYTGNSCPACQQGVERGQANADFWQNNQPAASTSNSQMDSYYLPGPAPVGAGQGMQGYNGITGQVDRTYIPVDPTLTPGLTPDGFAK